MSSPTITVLMPVFNAERYLSAAIESILNQTNSDFELLIVNDGSTDSSADIAQSYRDARVRFISHESNRGECYVRNDALNNSRGRYVALLDADDVAAPNRLEVQAAFLDHSPDVVMVGSSFEIIDQKGSLIGLNTVTTDRLELKWRQLFGNQFGHSTVMYRRLEAISAGGYGNYPFAQDFDLWRRLSHRGWLSNLGMALTKYRIHESSATKVTLSAVKQSSVLSIVTATLAELTEREVSNSAAEVVFRDSSDPAKDRATFRDGIQLLEECCSCFCQKLHLTSPERRRMALLAVTELQRIGTRNPNWHKEIGRSELRLLAAFDRVSLLRPRSIRVAWQSVAGP